jgi:uncharacterized membrane protein YcaP (DUF421 family)
MSSKRYQFKFIEALDPAELEARLREAGSQQWSAIGYAVLPDGQRSVLMERKLKVHHHGARRDHDRPDRHDQGEEAASAAERATD